MSGRKILFLVTIWLVPVVILVAFIAIIRLAIKSDPIAVAEADSRPVSVKPSPNDMSKNTESAINTAGTNTAADKPKSFKFYDALNRALAERRRRLEDLCERGDAVSQRVLNDYGAVFMAHSSVLTPPVCMFTDAAQVNSFQNSTEIAAENINGATIELQKAAMKALINARNEARANGLDITPRDGAEAARRSFEDTLRLWDSRFLPALKHWSGKGRITDSDAERLKNLPLKQQVNEVLKLEERGIFFSKDFSKSILYSVAAPGCSQHLSLLAFDANEFQNPKVRAILAKHGWFRTVQNDLPHFTFLGYKESELTSLGLRKMETKDGYFWIPNV
jgi:hypothetical protein